MAITDPSSFLYRVDAGAWAAVVGTDGFTDTGTITYTGTGDDEYGDYESANSEWTLVDTPPTLTAFDGANIQRCVNAASHRRWHRIKVI
jgi:hypothetical protein